MNTKKLKWDMIDCNTASWTCFLVLKCSSRAIIGLLIVNCQKSVTTIVKHQTLPLTNTTTN